jgi:hypothetical protein
MTIVVDSFLKLSRVIAKQKAFNSNLLHRTTPQSNGVVERLNQTLVEMARCMFRSKNVTYILWVESMVMPTYLKNRNLNNYLEDKILLEV